MIEKGRKKVYTYVWKVKKAFTTSVKKEGVDHEHIGSRDHRK